jgi:hypothetical protein
LAGCLDITFGCRGRAKLCLALLLGSLVLSPLVSQTAALAASVPCRSDPIIVVDGAALDVVSTLTTDPSAVRELDYQVTVPTGALIGKLTLTAGLGFPEKVTYVFSAAQPWGSIRVDASVITQDGVAPFPAGVQASALLAGSATAGGTSATTLSVTLDHLLML